MNLYKSATRIASACIATATVFALPACSIGPELHVKDLRPPDPTYANHYTDQGTIGTSCTIVMAKFRVDDQDLYEFVVYDRYHERVTRSRNGTIDDINQLVDNPPPACN